MKGMKSVLITGCSTGIGRASALDLSARGWRVFASVRKQADADQLLALDSKLTPVLLDVTDASQIAAAMQELAVALDGEPLHGLVQNAGIAHIAPLELIPIADFQHQLDVNLTGVLRVTQAALPLMRQGTAAKGSRRIVMISSISGRIGTPLAGAYNASKFGLEGMSDALRRELIPQEIDVVLIEPGAIRTAIWETSRERAEALLPTLEQSAASTLYQPIIDGLRAGVATIQERAIPAEHVAREVRKALESKQPKVRTLVGKDAKMGLFFRRILPTRFLDRYLYRDSLKPR